MTLLDDQIDAAERALRAFRVTGRYLSRRGRSTETVIDLAIGMELVLKNLRFQKEHEPAFRHLARQLIEASEDEKVQAAIDSVRGVFPGADIVHIDIDGLETAHDERS